MFGSNLKSIPISNPLHIDPTTRFFENFLASVIQKPGFSSPPFFPRSRFQNSFPPFTYMQPRSFKDNQKVIFINFHRFRTAIPSGSLFGKTTTTINDQQFLIRFLIHLLPTQFTATHLWPHDL